MKTLNLNVVINQGADFSLIIQVPGDPPPDLTDYEFEGQIRLSSDPASEVVANFVFEIRNQTTYPGQVYWTLSAEDSQEIATSIIGPNPPCRQTTPYVFDIKMTDGSDTITRIIQGIVSVSPEVTQPAVTP